MQEIQNICRKFHFLSIFFLLFILSVSEAQDSQNCTLTGRWADGPNYVSTARGNTVFLGNGGYLEVIDFSDPGNPVRLSRLLLPACIEGLTLCDGLYSCLKFKARP